MNIGANGKKEAGLNPNQLYRTLSAEGNPEVRNLSAILCVMGLHLAVQPIITH
ncbi:helix-turn-helix domain-containing transcriptional regulator [Photorhabdus tasmaniensis]|uniref:helix-turn-helix domain-containing transcriptional regulator n=1 Tax=Photorhabdus tasmaniensis TaxID=1004159 RepID=UPI0040412283